MQTFRIAGRPGFFRLIHLPAAGFIELRQYVPRHTMYLVIIGAEVRNVRLPRYDSDIQGTWARFLGYCETPELAFSMN